MRCPSCGAENPQGAAWCYLCNQPLAGEGAPAPGGAPPVSPVPPPPSPGMRPTYGPSAPLPAAPPARGGPSTVRILVGILVVLALLGSVLAAVFFLAQKTTAIKVPAPPGWEAADQETLDRFRKATGQEDQVTIDHLFTDGSLTNFIVVAHGDVYIMDSPEGEDLASVEDFFYQHKPELIEEMERAYSEERVSVEVKTYEAREMACGIPALHMDLLASGAGMYVEQYFLFFFKDDIMYFAIVNKAGSEGVQEEADFLAENISFE